jgi:fructosamine-3-kinase
MRADLRERIGHAVGANVTEASGLSGGDINDAYQLELADGRRLFAKTNATADETMFEREAAGLEWLREAGALRIPEVVAIGPDYLVLEFLEPSRPVADFDERLGRGLAALHGAGAKAFGLGDDNFIGRLPQLNEARDAWPDFYRDMRLRPQLAMARQRGLASARLLDQFERLCSKLDDLVGDPEPPARLHGDLWGGNLHRDAHGLPVLIDPAVYGGHREVDLAMMRLFGGFSARCFAAYAEAAPLSPGHADRVDLYQLYPLLVHVNLFGGGYLGSVVRVVSRYV